MMLIQLTADLLLSSWIWSLTFDFIHYSVAFCIMFIILLLFTKNTLIRCSLLTICSMAFAFAMLFFIVTIGLDVLCNWSICANTNAPLLLQKGDVMKANIILAFIITLLQGLFFVLLSVATNQKVFPYFCVAFLSNGIAALIAYGHIILTMRHLF